MDRRRIETIKRSFAEKLSSELTDVCANEYQGWSPEAIEAARELFAEREASGQLAEIDEQIAADRAEVEEFESESEEVMMTDPYSSWVSIIAWFYIIGGGLMLLTLGFATFAIYGKAFELYFQGTLDVGLNEIAFFILYGFVAPAVCTSFILVGRGLLARKSWARIAALCFCVPLAGGFPVGTILAIVTVIHLIDNHKYKATGPSPADET